ncbi:MAG: class I SAM-dependent methyltransferase [Phycisphaerae bacterium]|nr:class I SAM-dependent methyltransferase [Phycisphaerae bacterium]
MACRPAGDVYADFSAFYDLYVGEWLEDLPCYLEYARAARAPVVEIGAGTGRLTVPLARAGISVVAVDSSASMMARLEARLASEPHDVRRRVQTLRADVCELSLGTKHDLILVPFYAFNYLLTPEAQHKALAQLAAHLLPKGRLLIDVFVPYARIERCPSEPLLKVDTRDCRTGDRIRGWNAYSMDTQRQIETRRHVFEVTPAAGSVIRTEFTTERRYSFPAELESQFAEAGLAIEQVSTGYDGRPPDARSEQLLYVLRQP